MRTLMLTAAAAVLLPAAALTQAPASEVQDLDGWRAAKWGMTEAEALAAFPGEAERLAKPERLGEGTATVGIPAYKIQSKEFAVVFGFDEKGGLHLVRITLTDNIAPGVLHSGSFDLLETLLTEKYGKPTSSKDEQVTPSMSSRTRMWRLPRTVINLKYTFSAGFGTVKFFDVVMLTYTPPSKEADKL